MSELTLVRELDSDRASVWNALTVAENLAEWFWPASWETVCELDLRVGGRYRLFSAATELAVSGEYSAIEAQSRTVQSWKWDSDSITTVLTISLETSAAGTTLTLHHEGFEADVMRVDHLHGWSDSLGRLPEFLALRQQVA
jgi:uncharacterized protein YndB with AHSA1/START domain